MSNVAETSEGPRIPTWTLGERMAKARESAGFTQAEMGALFGVASVTVSSWETMTRQPKRLLATLARWAELTNVDYAWLLGTKSPDSHIFWQPGVVVDDGQLRLDFVLPPSRSEPELAVV